MRIIGCDPGKTTGIVSFSVVDNQIECLESMELTQQGAGLYFESLSHPMDQVVVCEAFLITAQTAKNTQAPWSLEVIGVVRYFCSKYGIPLVMQFPATAKRLTTNEVLQRAGLYVRGDHARDASRHALAYAVTNGFLQDCLKEG